MNLSIQSSQSIHVGVFDTLLSLLSVMHSGLGGIHLGIECLPYTNLVYSCLYYGTCTCIRVFVCVRMFYCL